LVVEITGLEAKDQVVGLICRTFEMLRSFADFDQKLSKKKNNELLDTAGSGDSSGRSSDADEGLDVRLSYSINLVLPKTDDPAVFNAIFKALREHLLRK
jgi:flagellar biosynthesis GTPase FlhF